MNRIYRRPPLFKQQNWLQFAGFRQFWCFLGTFTFARTKTVALSVGGANIWLEVWS